MNKADKDKLIAKYERKIKRERSMAYGEGYADGVYDEAKVKRATKYICPDCGREMIFKR